MGSVTEKGFLSPEEISLFHKQGYVIKKSAVIGKELHSLDQLTAQLIQTVKARALSDKYPVSTEPLITHIKGSQVIFKKYTTNTMSISRVVGCGGAIPDVLATLRSHRMATTFFDLLGHNEIEHIVCSFHPKEPNDGVEFKKHCDLQYRKLFDPEWNDFLGNGSYAICILAIDAMSSANGGLSIDRSSFPRSQADENKPEDVVSLTMEPGDLLFMHPEILHWSDKNVSTVGRRALLTGFCAWGANHKTYPGTAVNVHMTRKGDEIISEPSNWDQKGTSQTINH